MPIQFKRAEPLVKAVWRVCRLHLGEALARLRKSSHPASIHGGRKEIKKLRAILQLLRGEINRSDYRKAENALHRAADLLGAPRDARVTLKAFERLAGPEVARCFPKIQKTLQKNYRRETRWFQDDDSVAEAKNILKKVNRRVNRFKSRPGGWTILAPGLKQSYRLGQQAWKRVCQQRSPEYFHEWRRHVKTLCYQLRLLGPEWPAAVRAMTDGLEQLGEQLGEDHDLYLLKQFIKEHCAGQEAEARPLNQLIESHQKKLRAATMKLGVRLYTEAPAVVCARLETHWRTWHSKTAHR